MPPNNSVNRTLAYGSRRLPRALDAKNVKVHVARAYLDMARSVVDTKVYGDAATVENEDSIFALLGCTYVFSYMALTAFASAHLSKIWNDHSAPLRQKFADCANFDAVMRGPLRELKDALKELALQLKVRPLHEAEPLAWQELTEFVKTYRDYFVHPNPDGFSAHIEAVGNLHYSFPSRVASEVIAYFFDATAAAKPEWVKQSQLRCRGFDLVRI